MQPTYGAGVTTGDSGPKELKKSSLARLEGSTFHRVWVFGNDFLSSRVVVAADIILFGSSTATKNCKKLCFLGLNVIRLY